MGTLIVTEMVTVDGVAQGPSAPDEDRSGDFAALRLVDSAVFPNGTLKLDFATAGEPKFGNVGDPEEALRRLT